VVASLFLSLIALENGIMMRVTATSAWAQPEIESDVEFRGESYMDKTGRFMDRTHEAISRRVLSTANWIDRFFDDEHIEEGRWQIRKESREDEGF